MPTVVTKTIKPGGGGDYTSLQAANDALAGDLVAADQQLDLVCYAGDADPCDFGTGWTTDATRFIRVIAAEADRHAGVWDGAKAYLSGAFAGGNPGLLRRMPNYTRIEWLQIEQTGDDNGMTGILIGSAAVGIRVRGCIIKANPATTTYWNSAAAIKVGTDASGSHFIWNNIIYGWNQKSDTRGLYTNNHVTGKTYFYNNTVVDCSVGVTDGYGDVVSKDNLVSGCTTCFDGVSGAGNDASSDATASGTASRTNQTFTFVNAGAGDYHLDSADAGAKGFGADLSADADLPVSDDIDGVTRVSPWDIGADGVAVAVTLEQEGYRFYDDDGDEDASTALAAQDTPITVAPNTNFRLRTLLNATGDPATQALKLQYEDPFLGWRDVKVP